MVFTIRQDKGVSNTSGTTASFGRGKIDIKGDLSNLGTGKLNISTQANLSIAGDLINEGELNIRDYISEQQYKLLEEAIESLEHDSKAAKFLTDALQSLQKKGDAEATNKFKLFLSYIMKNPGLITAAVQIVIELFKS